MSLGRCDLHERRILGLVECIFTVGHILEGCMPIRNTLESSLILLCRAGDSFRIRCT